MIAEKVQKYFARVTNSGKYIPEIDGLRFVAIIAVIAFHLYGLIRYNADISFDYNTIDYWMISFLRVGHYGVELFFVLSGFILALPFASHYLEGTPRVSLLRYYLRRITRLEPPYLISLLIFFTVYSALKGGVFMNEQWAHLGASLFYMHNLIFQEMSTVHPVSWSLEVEIQFYLIVPLCVTIFTLSVIHRRLILVIVVILFSILNSAGMSLSYESLLVYFQYFMGGFLLADIYLSQKSLKKHFIWDAIALSIVVLFAYLASDANRLEFYFPCMVFIFCFCTLYSKILNWVLSNIYIRTIGGMCYSIYLVHYPIVAWVGHYTISYFKTEHFFLYFSLQFIAVTIPVLLVSSVFYLLVERPCMDACWPQKVQAWMKQKLC